MFSLLHASPAGQLHPTVLDTDEKKKKNLSALCIVSEESTECSWVVAKEIMFSFLHVTRHDRQNK